MSPVQTSFIPIDASENNMHVKVYTQVVQSKGFSLEENGLRPGFVISAVSCGRPAAARLEPWL